MALPDSVLAAFDQYRDAPPENTSAIKTFAGTTANSFTRGLLGGAYAIGNMGLPKDIQQPEPSWFSPVNVTPEMQAQHAAASVGGNIVGGIGSLLVPGGAVTRLGKAAGLGARGASLAGNLAAGAYGGIAQSPQEAGIQAGEFGAMDLANMIPNMPLRVLANAAIPVGDQLMRGNNPLSAQSMAQTGTQVGLPLILDALARRGGRPLLKTQEQTATDGTATAPEPILPAGDAPTEPIPQPQPANVRVVPPEPKMPDNVEYQGFSNGLHAFKDLETGGNFSVAHDELSPETVQAKADAVRESFKAPQMSVEDALAQAGAKEPSLIETQSIPQSDVQNTKPELGATPLLSRQAIANQELAKSLTLGDAIRSGDVVTYKDEKGRLFQRDDGVYFRRFLGGQKSEQRIFGNVPDAALSEVEGLGLSKLATRQPEPEPHFQRSLIKLRNDESGAISTPLLTRAGGAIAGGLVGGATDKDNPVEGAIYGALGGLLLGHVAANVMQGGSTRTLLRKAAQTPQEVKNMTAQTPAQAASGISIANKIGDAKANVAAKLDDAAAAQAQDPAKGSILGATVRVLEKFTPVGMRGDLRDLLNKSGVFYRNQVAILHDILNRTSDIAGQFTPEINDAALKYLTGKITPDEWKAASAPDAVRQNVEDLRTTIDSLKVSGAKGVTDADKKAMLDNIMQGWATRSFRAMSDPKYIPTDADVKALAAEWKKTDAWKNFSDANIEAAVGRYVASFKRTSSAYSVENADDPRISGLLFMRRKDLTPDQWQQLKALGDEGQGIVPDDALQKIRTAAKTNEISPELKQAFGAWRKEDWVKNNPEGAGKLFDEIAGREVLSPAHRAVLGEITNPVEIGARSAVKLLRTATAGELFNGIKNLAGDHSLVMDQKSYGEAMDKARADGDAETMRRLGNYVEAPADESLGTIGTSYVRNAKGEMVKMANMVDRHALDAVNAFDDQFKQNDRSFLQSLGGYIKSLMTGLNPARITRNWVQIPMFAAVGRAYDTGAWRDLAQVMKDGQNDAKAGTKSDLATKFSELREAGMLNAGLAANDAIKSAQNLFDPPAEGFFAGVRTAADFMRKMHDMPTDLVRGASYLANKPKFMEMARKMASDGTIAVEEIEQKARDMTRQFVNKYTLNFGGVQSGAMKALNKMPFVNPFLGYQMEVMRVMGNLFGDLKDVASKDDFARHNAYHSAASLAMMLGAPVAIAMGAKSMLTPDEQKQWEKMQKLSPEYAKAQIRIPLRAKPDGTFDYLNITPESMSDMPAMLQMLVKGDFKSLIANNAFMGWRKTPLINMAADLAFGQNYVTGKKFEGAGDYAAEIAQPLVPTFIPPGYVGQKIVRGLTPNNQGGYGVENQRTGRTDTPTTALLSLTGFAPSQQRLAPLLQQAAFQRKDELAQAKSTMLQTLRSNASDSAKQNAQKLFLSNISKINSKYASILSSNQP